MLNLFFQNVLEEMVSVNANESLAPLKCTVKQNQWKAMLERIVQYSKKAKKVYTIVAKMVKEKRRHDYEYCTKLPITSDQFRGNLRTCCMHDK